jgi:hypothetical protein
VTLFDCSVRKSLEHLTTILVLAGVVTSLSLSCGGSREPIIQKSSGAAGKKGTGGSTSTVEAGASNTGTGGIAVNPWAGIAGALIEIKPAWDWNGVIGTGQSLAVGNVPLRSTTSLYNNLMLSLDVVPDPPWDPTLPALSVAPLIELKNSIGYPSPYPHNRWGETPHSAMANQLSAMVRFASNSDFVSVHTVVGESGQGMIALKKNPTTTVDSTGRITAGLAYAASIFEVGAITRLAIAAGKTYGVGAIIMTHGETDSGSSTYKDELIQMVQDYNTDIAAITGQTTPIPMYISQQFAYPGTTGQTPFVNTAQWRLGVEYPGQFVCTGPKYQYPGHGDSVHLATLGYQQLGEKTGQIYYERNVLGHDWQPLQPLSASRAARVITVRFHVPVPPLAWEDKFPNPTTAWPTGKGFEIRGGGAIVPIESVAIVDDTVQITCGADLPATNVNVGYAMTAGASAMTTASNSLRWGQLRDSDPFIGSTTLLPQPNYAVAFEMAVP